MVEGRCLRLGILALATALGTGACSHNDVVLSGTAPPVSDATTTSTAPIDPVITVALPTVPPIALPDLSELTRTGDVVSKKLGKLVSPVSGVNVLSASCAQGGGNLVYQGSTGSKFKNAAAT